MEAPETGTAQLEYHLTSIPDEYRTQDERGSEEVTFLLSCTTIDYKRIVFIPMKYYYDN